MAKERVLFVCSTCGYESPRWMGKCPECGAWNTLEEQISTSPSEELKERKGNNKQRPGTGAKPMRLSDIPQELVNRVSTGITELDRVLGGGIVEGSLVLVGGDPGIGKSTLLLQVADFLARH